MATDESPATSMREIIRVLARRWQKKFDESGPVLARYFATKTRDRTDSALRSALKKAGIAIEWKLTRAMNNVMQATVGQQVSLITNLSEKALTDIEGSVLRSVAAGGDRSLLMKELQHQHGMARKRASLIAKDQNNKANSMMERVRQMEIGAEAIWCHSHGGKYPRPEHVKWGAEKKIYDPNIGMWSEVSKKYVWPGSEINCGCFAKTIFPGITKMKKAA